MELGLGLLVIAIVKLLSDLLFQWRQLVIAHQRGNETARLIEAVKQLTNIVATLTARVDQLPLSTRMTAAPATTTNVTVAASEGISDYPIQEFGPFGNMGVDPVQFAAWRRRMNPRLMDPTMGASSRTPLALSSATSS